MFMVHELDTDKELPCLWKPLGLRREKCGEEMPAAGAIALLCTEEGTSCFEPMHFRST